MTVEFLETTFVQRSSFVAASVYFSFPPGTYEWYYSNVDSGRAGVGGGGEICTVMRVKTRIQEIPEPTIDKRISIFI
jgi:hypothetical protein